METLPGLEPTFEEELYLHRVEVAQKRLEEAKETYQEQRGKLSALGEEVTPATFYEELFGGEVRAGSRLRMGLGAPARGRETAQRNTD